MSKHRGDMFGVRSLEFDRTAHTLRVGFATGAIYDFAEVPEHLYDELRHSDSPDEYFDANIREDFASARVGDVDLADVAHERREDLLLDKGWEDADADESPEPRNDSSTPRAAARRSRHRWVVDVLEEDSAAVEVDGRQITAIPRWILPEDARDGDVLRVTHDRSGTRSTIAIQLDPAATRRAYGQSAEQLEGKGMGDEGGDIDLREG